MFDESCKWIFFMINDNGESDSGDDEGGYDCVDGDYITDSGDDDEDGYIFNVIPFQVKQHVKVIAVSNE